MERKRSIKTTQEQYKLYLDYIRNNPVMKTGRLTPGMDPKEIENRWEDLVLMLNSCGNGPQKNVKGWKSVFSEWKSVVKRKARLLHVERQKTGGGPSEAKPLTDLELELLDVIGELVVQGLEDVPEGSNFTAATESSSTSVPVVEELVVEVTEGMSMPEATPPLHFTPPSQATTPPPAVGSRNRRSKRYQPYDTTSQLLEAFVTQQEVTRDVGNKLNENLQNISRSLQKLAKAQMLAARAHMMIAKAISKQK